MGALRCLQTLRAPASVRPYLRYISVPVKRRSHLQCAQHNSTSPLKQTAIIYTHIVVHNRSWRRITTTSQASNQFYIGCALLHPRRKSTPRLVLRMLCKMNVAARWLIIGVAVVIMTTAWAHPAPDPNRGISDALKYLQELDRIYAHVAMPSLRSDRAFVQSNVMSSDMENAISMLRLHELDKLYSDRIRPRFGKRTELKHALQDYDGPSEDNDKEWLSLSNGR